MQVKINKPNNNLELINNTKYYKKYTISINKAPGFAYIKINN